MKQIDGAVRLPAHPVSGLQHVSDLIYADGPLLSHYVHPKGDSYLYYWCDCDDASHRWMLIRVSEFDVLQLAYRFIPLNLVIPQGNLDDYVYFVDVSEDETSVLMCGTRNIPEDYKPAKGAYIEVDCSSSMEDYTILLDGELSPQDLFRLPRLMELLYSFQYAVDVLAIQEVEKFPWKNGFSSGQFDSWISRTIPFEDRLTVEKLQVASPGLIRFHASHGIFDSIASATRHYISEKYRIRKADRLLLDWISDKYTGDSKPGDEKGEYESATPSEKKRMDETLLQRLEYFLREFKWLELESIIETTRTPFEAAQVSRWYYRRVRDLAKAVESGDVKMPPTDD